MTIVFNKFRKLKGNSILLPELDLIALAGEITSVQCENEYIGHLFETFNYPQGIKKDAITLPEGEFKAVCLVQQTDGLYKRLTVIQTLKFWCELYQNQIDLEWILSLCELREHATHKVKSLNYSEQKRLNFASVLIQNATVYIFENPSLGLDIQSKHVLHNLLIYLITNKATVLLFMPNLEEAIHLGDTVYRYSERGTQLIEQKNTEDDNEIGLDEKSLIGQQKLVKVSAKIDDKIILFNPLEIDYIEARMGQVFLFVNDEEFITSHTIKELEQSLHPFGFFRCHRSYIVNLQSVREIVIWSKNSYTLSLDNVAKSIIPLSKGNYSKLKEVIQL